MIYKNFTKPPRGPKAAVFHPDNTYRKPPMILKIIQKAACDPKIIQKDVYDSEDYSGSRLWLWRLFRKPPVTLKIIQKACYGPEDYSESLLWPWRLFRKPSYDPENYSESRLWQIRLRGIFSIKMRGEHRRKSTNDREENCDECFMEDKQAKMVYSKLFSNAFKALNLFVNKYVA